MIPRALNTERICDAIGGEKKHSVLALIQGS